MLSYVLDLLYINGIIYWSA